MVDLHTELSRGTEWTNSYFKAVHRQQFWVNETVQLNSLQNWWLSSQHQIRFKTLKNDLWVCNEANDLMKGYT